MRATFTVHAIRLAVILALVGCVACATWAQAPAAESGSAVVAKKVSKATPVSTSRAATKPAGGPQEGIKVHGHWVIEVRNPDGTLADRREFDNALNDSQPLANLLSRNRAISQWLILLGNNGPGGQPCGTAAEGHECGIAERLSSRFPFSNVDYAAGLTVGVNKNNAGQVLLVGTTRASNDGLITFARTMVSLCPPGPASPTGCADTETFFNFTIGLVDAQMVKNGQSVDVTVTFSFS